MKTEHNIRYTGTSGHNGEDWYECINCKASDWIASCGEYDQLNFYYKPCISKPKEHIQLELFK
jgi:hypothetical protein